MGLGSGGRASTDCGDFFGWNAADEMQAKQQLDVSAAHDGATLLRAHDGVGSLQLMTLGLKTPSNFGSLYRLAACFGVRHVHHAGARLWADAAGRRGHGTGIEWGEAEWSTMHATSKGCEALVARTPWSFDELLRALDADQHAAAGEPIDRLPIVVLETTDGAVPLHGYRFPQRCVLLVGAEGSGVDRRVLQRLRPGHDACVYVPLPGAHKSLNVVEAACCGISEYFRQWPDPRGFSPRGGGEGGGAISPKGGGEGGGTISAEGRGDGGGAISARDKGGEGGGALPLPPPLAPPLQQLPPPAAATADALPAGQPAVCTRAAAAADGEGAAWVGEGRVRLRVSPELAARPGKSAGFYNPKMVGDAHEDLMSP